MKKKEKNTNLLILQFPPASFSRRLMALFYDTLILLSLLIVASAIIVSINGGTEISHENVLFKLYLFLVIIFYFVLSWAYGRQTIGMRAWQLFLVTRQGDNVSVLQSIIRFFIAVVSLGLFGLGFWWMLISPHKQSLHDVICQTHMIGPKKNK